MKLFAIIISSLFLIQACAAQFENLRLPAEMPENITIYLNEGGGKTRAYKKITIDGGVLEFEELVGGFEAPQKWSAAVEREDLSNLYKIFVENRFDSIKNDQPKVKVYDAGSESIAISIDDEKSFRVTYGKNSPLSGDNLARYQAVSKAIDDLVNRNRTVAKNDTDSEKFIQGKWRTGGAGGPYGWMLEWTFDGGKFKQIGYPPILQEGKYKVVKSDGEKLTLELYEQQGTFGEKPEEIRVTLDRTANQLTISGTKGFTRVMPEIKE